MVRRMKMNNENCNDTFERNSKVNIAKEIAERGCRLYVNSWGKKPKKMKRSKGSGRKVAALNYENICKMRFLNLLKLEYP